MKTDKKFQLHDELYKLGFSKGLLESVRSKQINVFLSYYEDEEDRLNAWIRYVKQNKDTIENVGGYLRSVMRDPAAWPSER